jgi:hypothetical protein
VCRTEVTRYAQYIVRVRLTLGDIWVVKFLAKMSHELAPLIAEIA